MHDFQDKTFSQKPQDEVKERKERQLRVGWGRGEADPSQYSLLPSAKNELSDAASPQPSVWANRDNESPLIHIYGNMLVVSKSKIGNVKF